MQTAVSGDVWRRIGWIACRSRSRCWRRWWLAAHIPRTIAIFVIAAFIAFGVQPIARAWIAGCPKPLAISIVFAVLLLIVAIGLVIVVPLTINQMQLLAEQSSRRMRRRPKRGRAACPSR